MLRLPMSPSVPPLCRAVATCSGMGLDFDELTRWLAVFAVLETKKGNTPDFKAAAEIFKDHCNGADKEIPHRVDRFIPRWWGYYEASPTKVGCMCRHGPCGRKSRVDPELVDRAAAHFSLGYISEAGLHKNWPTFVMALNYDNYLKATWADSGVSPRTFFAHILEVCNWPARQQFNLPSPSAHPQKH